jgi:transposase
MLCGVAPIPATSGLTVDQFRLNYAGDRHANNAIWRIVITRLGQHEPRTVTYTQRRLAEGKSKHIIRCLKRYVAREIFKARPR